MYYGLNNVSLSVYARCANPSTDTAGQDDSVAGRMPELDHADRLAVISFGDYSLNEVTQS
jgi:hypothetical protein